MFAEMQNSIHYSFTSLYLDLIIAHQILKKINQKIKILLVTKKKKN